ncbi:MAG TPA: TOBE domain-containing protein, partial [Verrucomicrobiota bacterium]|nr:TOBE domain-containing protein [Verrucomicrobiota bacterium]
HDQVEAITMGQRLAVMKDGAIQQVAEPLDVYRRPANLFVAEFTGSPPMNLFPGAIEMGGSGVLFRPAPPPQRDTTAGAPLPVARSHQAALSAYAGKPVVLGLRPEAIVFEGGLACGPDGVRVSARAEAVERLGAETHLHGSIGGIRFTARSGADRPLAPGQTVSVWLDLDRACYFDGASGQAIA